MQPDSVFATLTANQTASHTLGTSGSDIERVEVFNRDGTDEMFFTTDGSEPVVGGAGTYFVPAAVGYTAVSVDTFKAKVTVKIKSAAAQRYAVTVGG